MWSVPSPPPLKNEGPFPSGCFWQPYWYTFHMVPYPHMNILIRVHFGLVYIQSVPFGTLWKLCGTDWKCAKVAAGPFFSGPFVGDALIRDPLIRDPLICNPLKLLSGSRRSKAFSYFMTLTNIGIQFLGFRASFLIHWRSTEQFSTSLAFLGAQNLIGWATEITGQLLCAEGYKINITEFCGSFIIFVWTFQ